MLDLWLPRADLPLVGAAATALALGVLHGLTPDEHTWPITFSYAIGSYSTRRGLAVGLLFSAAFTLQRALGSELAYLALARWMRDPGVDYVVYLVVGAAMAVAGWYVLGGRAPWRLDPRPPGAEGPQGGITPGMALVHGFIAGWGVGAYAVILYTVLAPAMPSPWLGWLPGLCFGVGTTLVRRSAGGAAGCACPRRWPVGWRRAWRGGPSRTAGPRLWAPGCSGLRRRGSRPRPSRPPSRSTTCTPWASASCW